MNRLGTRNRAQKAILAIVRSVVLLSVFTVLATTAYADDESADRDPARSAAVERETLPGSPAPQSPPAPVPQPSGRELRLWVAAGMVPLPSANRSAVRPGKNAAARRGFRVEE